MPGWAQDGAGEVGVGESEVTQGGCNGAASPTPSGLDWLSWSYQPFRPCTRLKTSLQEAVRGSRGVRRASLLCLIAPNVLRSGMKASGQPEHCDFQTASQRVQWRCRREAAVLCHHPCHRPFGRPVQVVGFKRSQHDSHRGRWTWPGERVRIDRHHGQRAEPARMHRAFSNEARGPLPWSEDTHFWDT
jgi:hypothetical protein